MSITVEKLLKDARTLAFHLKDHDTTADNILATMQTLCNKMEAMKQYQDDIVELNEMAKYRPRSTLVFGLAQENHQIRQLQKENRELQAALEEHQSALELIMQKYREHTVRLLHSDKSDKSIQGQEIIDKDSVCQLMDKIDEMAGVMQKAIEVDERLGQVDKEHLSRLQVENKALREMLEICTTSKRRILPTEVNKDRQISEGGSDNEDDKTDTDCDSSVVIAVAKTKSEEEKENEENERKGSADVKNNECSSSSLSTETSLSSSSDIKVISESTKLLGESKSAEDIWKGRKALADTADLKSSVGKAMSSTSLKSETAVGTSSFAEVKLA